MSESDLLDFFLLRQHNIRVVVLGTMLLGIGSAAIGCYAFLRKRSLVGDAVAHAALPGVAVAFMLTGVKNPAVILVGAAIAGWLSMVAMDLIVRRSKIREDAAIGIVLSVFFGLGILLLTRIQKSGSADQAGLDKFLFGQAASLVTGDVVVFGAVSLGLVVGIVLLHKEFKSISFDADFARSIGLPVRGLELAMTTMLVLAVVVGIQAVGVVLMAAMLITPAAAARYWTDRLTVMLLLAGIFGAAAGYGGAFVSYVAPRMPTGPWIVTAGTLIFLLSLLAAPRRGVIARVLRNRRNSRKTLEENILKTLYQLGEEPGGMFRLHTAADVARRRRIPESQALRGLGVLRRSGFIQRTENGWKLTQEGEKQGRRVTRLHRLWEVYLTEHVSIAPDHVHDDAESIEHVLTPELEAELEAVLNRPANDPHQRAIPYQ
ncbi:MAG: metal ABC transporter permease [Chlorobi bacterium]|nr:MAG: DtxR family transcriptional regulator [Chlorobi bacterium OLB7]MBK8912152.1 metal ABC transporter permease [Chlorobiota bacterium]MBX7215871.1 metal ABC transporter permease [Candidatus Kapabacteria bacterium]